MNPDFRKVALIAASLGLVVSLFFALQPDDDDAASTTTALATAPATTEAPPPTTEQETTTAPAQPQVVRARIVVTAAAAPAVKRFSVQRDKQVELTVESALADEVHLHGYDLSAEVAPGQPATIRFEANAPGRFEIELESRGLQIGELEVRP